LMALLSAFCFVLQMFNLPLPGGTTGHATGASLVAVLLGPWPAVLCLSTTIVIQALFFGDGGVTAIGANCFNMAVVQVFSTTLLLRLLPERLRRNPTAAAAAAWFASIAAAAVAGLELGLQPALSHAPDGTPLYAPYPVSLAVPAMMAGHLIAGIGEAAVTGLVLRYAARSLPHLYALPDSEPGPELPLLWRRLRTAWLILGILVLLVPLGMLAPGTAWGEWGARELKGRGLGFIPSGMQRWEGLWRGLFPDYTITGLPAAVAYGLSALAGILLILGIHTILGFAGRKAGRKQG